MDKRIGFIDYNGNNNLPHNSKEIDNTQSSSQEVDMVNHPPHYNWIPNFELASLTDYFNFNRGQILKYVVRAGKKEEAGFTKLEKELSDFYKAKFYLEREIIRLEKLCKKCGNQ